MTLFSGRSLTSLSRHDLFLPTNDHRTLIRQETKHNFTPYDNLLLRLSELGV